MHNSIALEVVNLTKRYGNVRAVDQFSMRMQRGEIVALLGPSGCGKTTTLRLIAGLETPEEGQVLIESSEVTTLRPYQRNIGVLFQDYALFPHLSVSENIQYGMKYRKFPPKKISEKLEELVELARLHGLESRFPQQLSGGQQQRVALARALAPEPKLILLDEPLSALDARLRLNIRTQLKDILRSQGVTTILITHDQSEAMALSDRIVLMRDGSILQVGTPSDLYLKPTSIFAANFLGLSNWFKGTISEHDESSGMVSTEGYAVRVSQANAFKIGMPVAVCVRPEQMRLIRDVNSPAPPRVNRIAGEVADIMFLGTDLHYTVRVAGGNDLIVVEQNSGGRDKVSRGVGVIVEWDPAESVVLSQDEA